MKQLFIILLGLITAAVFSQSTSPAVKVPSAKTIEGLIPKGWRQIAVAKGDLNKDSTEDVALVIESTDKENFITNENMGSKVLNVNPRQLLILFKDKVNGSYNLAIKQVALIPEANDPNDPCITDPLLEGGGITIKRGTIVIDLYNWVSCGSYWAGRNTYVFRYQDGGFFLIGYDTSEFNRATGEENRTSVNFITNKKIITAKNVMGEEGKKPKAVTEDIKVNKLLRLDDLDGSTRIEF